MIAVHAIVVRPLTEIENFVSRQAVSVLVEFHLAASGVCKITQTTEDFRRGGFPLRVPRRDTRPQNNDSISTVLLV